MHYKPLVGARAPKTKSLWRLPVERAYTPVQLFPSKLQECATIRLAMEQYVIKNIEERCENAAGSFGQPIIWHYCTVTWTVRIGTTEQYFQRNTILAVSHELR